jgi:hypothetical protein
VATRQERIKKLLQSFLRDQEIGLRGGIADRGISEHLKSLCEQHGYGNVVATASTLYREKDPSGGFCFGPCAAVAKANVQEAAALGIRSDYDFGDEPEARTPLKLTVEIELGNDTMQSYADVRATLQMIAKRPGNPKVGDGNVIMDENGNTVGKWEIVG